MKRIQFLCALAFQLCIFGLNPLIHADDVSQTATRIEEAPHSLSDIDSLVETALALFDVPGAAVGIVVDGTVVLAKGYGLRDKEKGLPVTDKTVFAIASCTKAFTTFVLASLVDEGIISWDDPVIKHIPEFCLQDMYATHNVTIRDLLSHRSGLPRHDYVWYNSGFTMEELLPRLRYLEPVCDLRGKFYYNNLMYGVAGLVIERVTGQSFEENVQKRVFHPLGLVHSNFSVVDTQQAEDFSKPYEERNGALQEIPFRNISNIGSAASINSSISDMVKWISVHITDQKLVREQTLKEMHSLQIPTSTFSSEKMIDIGYGLGWCIGLYNGHYLVEHAGSIDGFYSRVLFLPQEKIAVVILSNSRRGGELFVASIGNSIIDKLLNSEEIDWLTQMNEIREKHQNNEQEVREDSEQGPLHRLDEYVGTYHHPGYGTIQIYLEGNQLFALYNCIITPLKHTHYDVFTGSEMAEDPVFAGTLFSFYMGWQREIVGLQIPLERSVNMIFFQKLP